MKSDQFKRYKEELPLTSTSTPLDYHKASGALGTKANLGPGELDAPEVILPKGARPYQKIIGSSEKAVPVSSSPVLKSIMRKQKKLSRQGTKLNSEYYREQRVTFKEYIKEYINESRQPIDWNSNYGKTFKIVHTPEGKQSSGEWTPDLVSVVTPENGDAWTDWKEVDKDILSNWKDNWNKIQQSLGDHKYEQIIRSMNSSLNEKSIHDPVRPGILKRQVRGKMTCSKARSLKSKQKNKGNHTAKAAQRYLNYHCQ